LERRDLGHDFTSKSMPQYQHRRGARRWGASDGHCRADCVDCRMPACGLTGHDTWLPRRPRARAEGPWERKAPGTARAR
jgi:hypothetical protein